jgi:topoisomerase-4 subunit A
MGVTLIEMHGNNGSIDGDSPAAMRYTETRLSKNSEYLLADIDKKTVNFAPNFDDEELEPTVLPAKFPNILLNGATGISAGYATNIPPHNLCEVIDATIRMIDNPNMNIDDLLEIMHGPDFPTGGIVQGLKGIKEAFETGRGKVIVRSKTTFEDINKEGQKRIVVTEIPYEVNKGNLVKKIDQMRLDKVVEDIVEVRDESDREGLRIAIDLRKGANHEAILTYLFKNTDLQISYSYNMVAICNRRPMTLGVLDILKAYVEHQKEIVTNRSNFELEKAKKRIHILEGLIHMVDVLEEVIKEIRSSKGKADAKNRIMNAFGFTELQAEAIVTLQLYRLSSTDVTALINEKSDLDERVKYLEMILSNEKELLKVIKGELRDIKNAIGKPRLSVIEEEVAELKVDETHLIPKEDVMCCVTKDGYIKRSSIKSFQASVKNGIKEGDAVIYSGMVNTLDTLLVFTSQGNYFYIPVYKLTDVKWKDLGDHLSSISSLDKGKNERVISVMVVSDFNQTINMLFGTKERLI